MTDIVERLRMRHELSVVREAVLLYDEAADEIERLRRDVSYWDGTVRKELALEIERLRALLRSAYCPGGGYTGQPKDEEPIVENCLKAGTCGCDFGAALEPNWHVGGQG